MAILREGTLVLTPIDRRNPPLGQQVTFDGQVGILLAVTGQTCSIGNRVDRNHRIDSTMLGIPVSRVLQVKVRCEKRVNDLLPDSPSGPTTRLVKPDQWNFALSEHDDGDRVQFWVWKEDDLTDDTYFQLVPKLTEKTVAMLQETIDMAREKDWGGDWENESDSIITHIRKKFEV